MVQKQYDGASYTSSFSWCRPSHVEDGDMERILTRVQLPNVIWIRWYKCPYSSLPTWIPTQNLTYLEARGVTDLCSPPKYSKVHRPAKASRTDFYLFNAVLPPQVAHQRSLAELRLMCTNIKELPVALGDLSNLEVLEIGSPDLHSLPPSLCKLKNLKRLEIRGCQKLKYLPDSLELLTDFSVTGCPLTELVFKRVEVQREASVDSSFKEFMPRLQRFYVSGTEISKISFGEGVCPNLQSLDISYCKKLEKIEGLSGLPKLKKLWIVGRGDLEELPGVELCRLLEETFVHGSLKLRFKKEVVIQLMRQDSFAADTLADTF